MCAELHKEGDKEAQNVPYRPIIGSLMYFLICFRPDMIYAVNSASQHLEKPEKIHWNAAKRILKYLRGILDHGLYFLV